MNFIGAVLEFSMIDWVVGVVFFYFIYRVVLAPRFRRHIEPIPPVPCLEPMKKQDMTVQQLRHFDGISDKNQGRILLACDGKIFDVTRGKKNYGPDGVYGSLAGRDASRALATFQLDDEALSDEYDDLNGLESSELEDMRGWAETFKERYPIVGNLLKPNEIPTDYHDQLAELPF